jgi:hypothetical protein
MSRPSATRPGGGRKARCRSSNAARTAGITATTEAMLPVASARSSRVTSRPSSSTCSAPAASTLEAGTSSPAATAAWPAFVRRVEPASGPRQRGQPVQRSAVEQVPAELPARSRATVPLPDPLGPSMAMTARSTGQECRRPSVSRARASLQPQRARQRPAKPGNEVATLATSRISIGADARRLATANAIATRWSPWLSTCRRRTVCRPRSACRPAAPRCARRARRGRAPWRRCGRSP